MSSCYVDMVTHEVKSGGCNWAEALLTVWAAVGDGWCEAVLTVRVFWLRLVGLVCGGVVGLGVGAWVGVRLVCWRLMVTSLGLTMCSPCDIDGFRSVLYGLAARTGVPDGTYCGY